MRKSIALAVAVMFLATFASAQMKSQTPKPAQKSPIVVSGARQAGDGSFPRISQADAMKLYKQGKAVFIDVRSNQQFSQGHIRGALSIPGSEIIKRFAEVPPQKTVITYCACSAEQSSGRAAANLIAHGVKNVWALKGGWQDWKTQGGATAAGPK